MTLLAMAKMERHKDHYSPRHPIFSSTIFSCPHTMLWGVDTTYLEPERFESYNFKSGDDSSSEGGSSTQDELDDAANIAGSIDLNAIF